MPVSVSACLIVKNEENNIEDCLKSLINSVDEIIIVDTGSDDNTKQIVQKYTQNIYDFKWVDDFSKARNYSLSKATSDFILIIDADERLLNGGDLRNFLSTQNENFGGWLVNLDSSKNNNGYISKYTTQLLRLFRNKKEFYFEGAIHEQILHSITNSNYRIGNSDIRLEHIGYDLDEQSMKKKQERNLNLLIKQVNESPNDAYNLFNLAKTYFALKDLKNAEKYFILAIENSDKNGVIYPSALNYFATLKYQLKDYNKVIELCEESLKINEHQAFANYIFGDTYNELGDYKKSLSHYLKLEKEILNPTNLAKIIGDYHLPFSQVCFRIGRAYINLNDLENAKLYFEKGLKNNQKDKNCFIGLADYFVRNNNFDESLKHLNQALILYPNDDELLKFISIVKSKMQSNKSFISQIGVKRHSAVKDKKVSSVGDLKNRMKKSTKVNHINEEKPLITLSMIVKNEEKMLEDCLKSVQGIVDEIVIVDTGSTDNTLEIAEKYNARIFHFDWIDDFAAARNEALKHSTGEWILYLDADERIDLANLDVFKLKNDLKNAESNLGGIILTIESDHSNMDGSTEKHKGGYPRLFRNLGYPKIYFKGRVHEQITPSLMEHNLGMMNSDIKIIHEGYNIPKEEMQKKLKRNYTLLLRHVQEEPLNGYAWYQLGQTLGRLQLIKESEDAIKMAIECKNLSSSVYASAASTLAQYAGNKKDYESALFWAEQSLRKAPNQIYGLNLKGYALLELNRKTEAKDVFALAHQLWKNQDSKVPQSGFDIMIKEEVILNGLKRSEG